MARALKPSAVPPTSGGGHRSPLIMTAVDLSHVAPGVRLGAEDDSFLTGALIGLAISLGLWAAIWSFV